MQKPLYQRIFASYLPGIFLGVTLVASFFDVVSNLSIITPFFTYFGTILVVVILVTIQYVLKRYPVNWIAKSGEVIRIKSLGVKSLFVVSGVIFSLWIPRFFTIPQNPAITQSLPPITVIPPTVIVSVVPNTVSDSNSNFEPVIEEFDTGQGFTFTTQNILFDRGRVLWYFSRNNGDQFAFRKIPTIRANSNLRFTVTGQIDSWSNNCRAGAGIGNSVGQGIAIYFGYYGGGCTQNGAFISADGINLHFLEDECEFLGQWPWIKSSIPYRATLEIKGSNATLFVEDVAKVFATKKYNENYSVMWIGNRGDGDWPECTGIIESVTIEPVEE